MSAYKGGVVSRMPSHALGGGIAKLGLVGSVAPPWQNGSFLESMYKCVRDSSYLLCGSVMKRSS